jgi:ABC-type cobalamin/Fe3+-siderophores transport system ATPase subunit
MTTPLILESLEVRGFRAFNHLLIERLGRVNLIVGKNNVGKTSLLEALWLYVFRGSSEIIWEILEVHDERKRPQLSAAGISEERHHAVTDTSRRNYKLARYQTPALRYLFYGRPDIRERIEPLVIGPINSPERALSVAVGYWFAQGKVRWPLEYEERDTVEDAFLGLSVRLGDQKESVYRLDNSASLLQGKPPLSNCVFLDDYGLTDDNLWEYWDAVALTDLEDDVVKALRIIARDVERVNMVGSQQSSETLERIPVVKVVGIDDPLPLRSLGEGMNRLFGIALALVNAKGGILLVDEVESGLHYSVQPDVWRLIFETAQRLNVQVFATTHSMDCIEAFQQAAEESEQEQGVLIRLENQDGVIIATEFDERRLGIATREEIEVR